MSRCYEILQTFEITARGVAVVISEPTALSVGKPFAVEIVTPDGTVLSANAFKEWLLRRHSTPIEGEAFLLVGLHKCDVPSGSRLRFINEAI